MNTSRKTSELEEEITEEMFEAGADAWFKWQQSNDGSSRNLAKSLYLVMRTVAKKRQSDAA
jgi:hypothetical protein